MLFRNGAHAKLVFSYQHNFSMEVIFSFYLFIYFVYLVVCVCVCVFYVLNIHSILKYLPVVYMFSEDVPWFCLFHIRCYISYVNFLLLKKSLWDCWPAHLDWLSPLSGYTEISCHYHPQSPIPSLMRWSSYFLDFMSFFPSSSFIPSFSWSSSYGSFLRKSICSLKLT